MVLNDSILEFSIPDNIAHIVILLNYLFIILAMINAILWGIMMNKFSIKNNVCYYSK